jgi:hypothetical protein
VEQRIPNADAVDPTPVAGAADGPRPTSRLTAAVGNAVTASWFVWAWLGVLALLASWLAWLGRPDFPLDDAYILQHAVERLLGGGENRFPGVSPVQGLTSPAHAMLVSLPALLMPAPWAQMLVALAACLAVLAGVYRLARDEGVARGDSVLLTALAPIAGLTLYHIPNGLETGLAMAAMLWTLVLYRTPVPRRRWHALLLGWLPFIRPEIGALALLVMGRALWRSRRAGAPATPLLLWPLLGALPPLLFLALAGGDLLPGTLLAKAYFFAEGCRPLAAKLWFAAQAITRFLDQLGLAGIGFLGLLVARQRGVLVAFLGGFLAAYVLYLPGALFHNWSRYLYLLIPLLIAGWIGLLAASGPALRIMARVGLALAVLTSAWTVPVALSTYAEGIRITRVELAGVSRWLARNANGNDPVLIHDAGYLSLLGRQPLVDLVGLKTPSSVAIHRDRTWAACGRDPRALDLIARRGGVRYAVFLTDWDRLFGLSDSLRATGWRVERADGERGDTRYKVYRLTAPAASGPE